MARWPMAQPSHQLCPLCWEPILSLSQKKGDLDGSGLMPRGYGCKSSALVWGDKSPVARITPAAKEMFLAPLKIIRNILRGNSGNWLVLLFLSF